MSNPLTPAASRLIAALGTYHEQATGPTLCSFTGTCWRRQRDVCTHDSGACSHQIPPAAGNWLPVEVAARELQEAVKQQTTCTGARCPQWRDGKCGWGETCKYGYEKAKAEPEVMT